MVSGVLIMAVVVLMVVVVVWCCDVARRHGVYRGVRRDYVDAFGDKVILDVVTEKNLILHKDTPAYKRYFRRVVQSSEWARNERIVFTGLCQDHGRHAMRVWLPVIRELGSYFKDYRVVIVENDSKDDTREVLLRQAQKDPRFIVLCGDSAKPPNSLTCRLNVRSVRNAREKEKQLQRRVATLGKFRQVYWDFILREFPDYDYACVLDWDLEGVLSVPGFFHGLYHARNSDAVACNSFYQKNGKFFIYDTYPLLDDHRCGRIVRDKQSEDERVQKKMNGKLLNGINPVSVDSAFGGLALYNIQNARPKKPRYTNPECPVECEHTTFNRNLIVHVDPWMVFHITKNRR